jgi:hypothetical protein
MQVPREAGQDHSDVTGVKQEKETLEEGIR